MINHNSEISSEKTPVTEWMHLYHLWQISQESWDAIKDRGEKENLGKDLIKEVWKKRFDELRAKIRKRI